VWWALVRVGDIDLARVREVKNAEDIGISVQNQEAVETGVPSGVVTSLKEEHENSASRIFSNDRDCLAPHIHSRRAKGSVRPCRNEMTLDVERVVGGCVS
jgi:hypothetical protein